MGRNRRYLLVFGVLLLAFVAAGASAPVDKPDPYDLTSEGAACLNSQGFDASSLRFVALDDGKVGYTSDVTNDLSDLDTLIPRVDSGGTDASSALAACLEQLAEQLPDVPQLVDLEPTEEDAIRRCIDRIPDSGRLEDLTIKQYNDGGLRLEYLTDDMDAHEMALLDAALGECLFG